MWLPRCWSSSPELGKFGELSEIAREQHGTVPDWFAEWVEIERVAAVIRWWEPLLIPGLLQVESYARALLGWGPDSGGDLEGTVADRLDRQKIFDRELPPEVWFLLGESVFSNLVGSAEIMHAQIDHLIFMSQRPHVTIQVVPAVAVPSVAHGISLTDCAAYSETSVNGNVWTDEETRSSLGRVFDTLRSEAWRASESLVLINEASELWTGGNLLTATATADSA